MKISVCVETADSWKTCMSYFPLAFLSLLGSIT